MDAIVFSAFSVVVFGFLAGLVHVVAAAVSALVTHEHLTEYDISKSRDCFQDLHEPKTTETTCIINTM
jgi:hypothetical protein